MVGSLCPPQKESHSEESQVKVLAALPQIWHKGTKVGGGSPSIDKENRDSIWGDAIKKEMPKIIAAVEEHKGQVSELVFFQ